MRSKETWSLYSPAYSIKDLREKASESLLSTTLYNQPIRFVPQDLVIASQELLEAGSQVRDVASYLIDAYEFYRGCVCWGESRLGVPLTRREAWEWLDPADFSWLVAEEVRRGAQLAGKGLDDRGLGESATFLVDHWDNLGFVDYLFWQEETNALLQGPLRRVRDVGFFNERVAYEQINGVIGQLALVYPDAVVKTYDFATKKNSYLNFP